ncbi:hypothetical protein CFK39_07985 [Brachybacterium avium]|uniref:ESX secretion-associated protein EspG n=1 Tax=Brachybacterium avium TaxID=2017485 RepID=A0A220UCE8_9MICO|nr:hypothetical protein [Brachybacterium avium]ASK65787.1 hypothetical protein CFK39_07985 [Brachybacterium avium]
MTADDTTMEHRPRITSLPGDARLVRISEPSWAWVRAIALEQEPPAEITEEQIVELELVGLLIDAPGKEGGLVIDPHWQHFLRSALSSPVGIELVCVDGDRAWTTRIRIAGRVVAIIDQSREVTADAETMQLGRRADAVILGLTTIEHLSETFEALVPQRPAFTAADPAPAPAGLADAPALAEVQMLVIASPTPEQTVISGGSWYAYGQDGEQLAVLVPGEDGAEARELDPGSLTAAMRAKVIAAIGHVTAHSTAHAAGSAA